MFSCLDILNCLCSFSLLTFIFEHESRDEQFSLFEHCELDSKLSLFKILYSVFSFFKNLLNKFCLYLLEFSIFENKAGSKLNKAG